jgi:hypothetical protein
MNNLLEILMTAPEHSTNPPLSADRSADVSADTSVYHDTAIDRLFIWLFSRKMARAVGQKTDQPGYEGFVDLSRRIMNGRAAAEQQQVVSVVLRSLVPGPVLYAIRTLFSPTQLVCELNAWFATRLFEWLVGPCEVRSVEVVDEQGRSQSQASGVHIKKCRYLESSGCVGMCVNMCKLPTQRFFTEDFGIPLTMTPNFEDMSCEMVFGQAPPDDDPVYGEPCLVAHCSMAAPTAEVCPKLTDGQRSPKGSIE